MVGPLGLGPPSLDDFRHVWVFLAVAARLAGAAAVAMEVVRAPATQPVEVSAPQPGHRLVRRSADGG